MKQFTGLSQAESYAEGSSKKHNDFRYVAKSKLVNSGIVYFVYEKMGDLDNWEKIISTFKNGVRQ